MSTPTATLVSSCCTRAWNMSSTILQFHMSMDKRSVWQNTSPNPCVTLNLNPSACSRLSLLISPRQNLRVTKVRDSGFKIHLLNRNHYNYWDWISPPILNWETKMFSLIATVYIWQDLILVEAYSENQFLLNNDDKISWWNVFIQDFFYKVGLLGNNVKYDT